MSMENVEKEGYLRPVEKELPTDRDWKGVLTVGGKDYWVSAYDRKTKDGGRRFLKLLLNEKRPTEE